MTGAIRKLPSPAANSAVLLTLLCSTALVTIMVLPDVLRALVRTPRIAMLLDSVPLLVKYMVSGFTFMCLACTLLAHSNISCEALPSLCNDDGLPYALVHAEMYFDSADGLIWVVAALSAYTTLHGLML
jgi:hypothetical protein